MKSLVFGAAGRLGNLVFMLYPEQIGYYQEWPLGVARTLQRGNVYGLPDDRREMRLARYLAMRIDREATREDHPITKRTLAGNGGHTQRRASETRANNQAIVTPLYISSW